MPGNGGRIDGEPEIEHLSAILDEFNKQFGGIEWRDADRVRKLITEEIPARVEQDTKFRNARENSDRENARIEHDRALGRVMTGMMADDTELFRQFMDNQSFKQWVGGVVFGLTCQGAG